MARDPATTVVVPVEASGDGHVIPEQEPTGPVASSPSGPVTRHYGTLLGSTYLEDPVMGLVASLPQYLSGLESVLRPWFAILIAVSLVLSANAVVGGSARVAFSLARHHQMPTGLGRVHATRMTPYVGVILFGLVVVVLLVPSDPLLLLELFGFGAALAFTLANASVIALRYKEPSISRPFVVPFTARYRGVPLPIPAVIGAVAMAAVWVLMVITHGLGAVVGFAWLGGGLLLYVLYRKSAGYRLLTQPHEAALPAAALADVDYDRILVPVLGTRLSDEMMVLACQLAAEKGAVIDVLYVLEVPMNLPLDASLPLGRARGKHVLDTAMAVAREFGVEAWPHLVSARSPGRAIVDTAREWDSHVIIMGEVRKPRADGRLVGDTVAHVMRQARAEVLLNLVDEDYPMEGSAAEFDAEQETDRLSAGPSPERA
jgi:APA family basic amino acid/polyamine antiporter